MCVQEEGEKKGCKMETDGAEKEVEHEKRDLANYLSPFSLITFDFFFFSPHLGQDVRSSRMGLSVSIRLNAPWTECTCKA